MAARYSPFVQYPLQRPAVLWCVWMVAAVLGAALLVLWVWHSALAGAGWVVQMWLAIASWVWAVGGACRSLLRWPEGTLKWNGLCWALLQDGVQAAEDPVTVQVVADMQQTLVLRLQRSQGGRSYVWLEEKWAPEHWMNLRRAVYSSACLSQFHPKSGSA